MNGNRTLSRLNLLNIVLVFSVSCLLLTVMPAMAQEHSSSVPSNKEDVAREVLANEIMQYLRAEYLGERVGHLSSEELRESASYYPHYPRHITDSTGRSVTIYKPINRLIVFSATYGDAIRIVNAKERVVGVSSAITKDVFYFPVLSKLPAIGSLWEPDLEAIIALEPDVILTCEKFPAPEKVDDLLPENIKVIRMVFTDPVTLEEELNKLGYLLDKEKEAGEFIKFYRGHMGTIESRLEVLSEDRKPKVYFEYSKEYEAASEGSVHHHLCFLAGGNNIAVDLLGAYPKVDAEWLLAQDPAIIVKWAPRDTLQIKRDELKGRTGLADVTAVKAEKVYAIAYEITTRPACFVGVLYMAKWCYPELFEDIDPKAIYNEYQARFLDLDIDMDVVYPSDSVNYGIENLSSSIA